MLEDTNWLFSKLYNILSYIGAARNIWTNVFNHKRSPCTNDGCNDKNLVWMDDRTSVTYNSSLFRIHYGGGNEPCGYLSPKFSPQSSSQITGKLCKTTYDVMCSVPCDDEGNKSMKSKEDGAQTAN